MNARRRAFGGLVAALLMLSGAPQLLSVDGVREAPRQRSAPTLRLWQGPVRGAGRGFTWEAPADLEGVASRIAPQVEELLDEARAWIGLTVEPAPVHLQWVRDREEMARALGQEVPEWYGAVAVPAQRRMIIATRIAGSAERVRTTLRHEVLHLVMADLGAGALERLPAWFQEGCAEVFAGDIYLGQVGISLSWRSFFGELEQLSEFRDGFPDETLKAAVGYRLGHAFVARLQRQHGDGIVAELLRRVARGATLDEALIATTGLSEVTHEEQLRAELRSVYALVSESQPQIFLLLAVAILIGFPLVRVSRRRKRRRFEERWDRQDRLERLDPLIQSGQWKAGEGAADAEEPPEELEDWVDREW